MTAVPSPHLRLLAYGQKVDLSSCDREPIHIPGHTKPHGVLLACDPSTLVVENASGNTGVMLGVEPAALLGRGLDAVLDETTAARIALRAQKAQLEKNPLFSGTGMVLGKGPFHAIAHVHDGALIVELEPVVLPSGPGNTMTSHELHSVLAAAARRLRATPTLSGYCQAVAEEVREVSGYDRVMVYRFLEDWSGHVVAEDMVTTKGLAPFLDLHYPASDIPVQARALFAAHAVNMLPDARYVPVPMVPPLGPRTGRPLDMSYAYLRGVSQMYTEYLTNMGVRATMTLAITKGDALWGLVACHHYGSPREVSYDVRSGCELLARLISLQMMDTERAEHADYAVEMRRAQEAIAARIDPAQPLVRAFLGAPEVTDALFDAAGFAIVEDGVHVRGETPPPADIESLVAWLGEAHPAQIVATSRLPALYPQASAFQSSGAGLLAIPLAARGEYLLFFRPEIERTVTWAGDPHKPMHVGPMGDRLTPRKSFELWKESVRGTSKPWLDVELEAANTLRTITTEIVLRKNDELARLNAELARSNEELDAFAHVASHDLNEPLRGIYNYSQFLLEDYADRLDDAGKEKLKTLVRLTKRMQALIDSLLHFARTGRANIVRERLDLGEVAAAALDLVDARLRESGATIQIARPLPIVHADPVGLQEVLQNLISNALKYNDKPYREVELAYALAGEPAFPAQAEGSDAAFSVRDNGIGMPAEHLDEVFNIFKRLHGREEFGGGTGVGLSVVKKVIDRHGGRIWIDSIEGVGTSVWFTLGGAGGE
jgi:chemotaxis family two-component system sensor kinase Cph1